MTKSSGLSKICSQAYASLLDGEGRRQYAALTLLSICSSLLQTLGVAAISLFFTVLLGGTLPAVIKPYVQADDMVGLGSVVLISTLLGTILSALATYFGISIPWRQYPKLATRLLYQYLKNDYEWHISQNPDHLVKNVISEAQNITNILQSMVLITVRGMDVIFIAVLLFRARPTLSFVAFSSLSGIYLLLYLAKRQYLNRLGYAAVVAGNLRQQAAVEALDDIKVVKVSRNEEFFVGRFSEAATKLGRVTSNIQFLSAMPRFLVEALVFGGLVGFVVISSSRGWATSESVPVLALYGAAAIRLLPGIQQIYTSLANIIAAQAAVEVMIEGLTPKTRPVEEATACIHKDSIIEFEAVEYTYPSEEKSALSQTSFFIRRGEKVGVVGISGAGKTTLVDLVLGLLVPTRGKVRRTPGLQLAYIPQKLHFMDGTILSNSAPGVPTDQIDRAKLALAFERADFRSVIDRLSEGVASRLGKNASLLSGGQRQRFAIARGLYQEPDLIVFDEACNALDVETEQRVVAGILQSKSTVLFISHRLASLRNFSRILFVQDRTVSDCGTFQELLERNAQFRSLAASESFRS